MAQANPPASRALMTATSAAYSHITSYVGKVVLQAHLALHCSTELSKWRLPSRNFRCRSSCGVQTKMHTCALNATSAQWHIMRARTSPGRAIGAQGAATIQKTSLAGASGMVTSRWQFEKRRGYCMDQDGACSTSIAEEAINIVEKY
jgi:hypothetical protein